MLRGVDCENVRVCPRKLLAFFPAPICALCNSFKHVVLSAVAFRDDANEFRALEAKARWDMVAMHVFFRFLVAVAKHLLGADMSVAASDSVS